jgi:hypothetical protein
MTSQSSYKRAEKDQQIDDLKMQIPKHRFHAIYIKECWWTTLCIFIFKKFLIQSGTAFVLYTVATEVNVNNIEVVNFRLFAAEFQIGPIRSNGTIFGSMDNVDIPLRGPKSIRGRSLLMTSSKGRRACATISTVDVHKTRTAVARLQGNMAGNIFFRQFITPPADTTIFADLYKLIPDGVASNISYRWLLMTTGPLDRTRPEDQVSCRNMRVLFDPDFRDEQKDCAEETPQHCKIGNMMGKFGGMPVGLGMRSNSKMTS